jgi:hypothetical protein
VANELVLTPLPETWEKKKAFDRSLLELAKVLAT